MKQYLGGLPTWSGETIVSILQDLDAQWLDNNWPKRPDGHPEKINRKCFRDFRHDHLFYHFRSKLVHETRDVHGEDELELGEKCPFYHKVRVLNESNEQTSEHWKLMHPPKFVENLALNILSGLSDDCRIKAIDPWMRLQANHNQLGY